MLQVTDNAQARRFELAQPEGTSFADYRRDGDRLVIVHVEAPPALRGTGAAGRLMEGILAVARGEGRKVEPLCGYAAAYIRRHPAHHHLLA